LRENLGKTALQAINERIAIEARVELRSGQKSIKEVAIDLGFDDPLYFSRFFKKQFGVALRIIFQIRNARQSDINIQAEMTRCDLKCVNNEAMELANV
jgi:AraC-like DNA-binding protein